LSCAGCSAAPQAASPTPLPSAPTSVASPTTPITPPDVDAPAPPAPVAPARVVIPTVALDEPLIELGIADDGGMEVPVDYDEVGWFSGGGRPGGNGPTVIAAHVDSPTGPAVFQDLESLAVGDVVEVYGADGVVHVYRVTETADYPKSAFPTARVFGATARDELRLITCGGVFDRDAGSYVDNRVVYAEPA
ncbi:class F sortase, partial [uncultured Microbacterium sp.]|uniref:class F sortase n=1 Tax=uncultured Microbacterium sp. TaxID=191216 RepID=UPI0028D3707B